MANKSGRNEKKKVVTRARLNYVQPIQSYISVYSSRLGARFHQAFASASALTRASRL